MPNINNICTDYKIMELDFYYKYGENISDYNEENIDIEITNDNMKEIKEQLDKINLDAHICKENLKNINDIIKQLYPKTNKNNSKFIKYKEQLDELNNIKNKNKKDLYKDYIILYKSLYCHLYK